MHEIPLQRVAAIHDLSGFGRASLTVVIPILASMGVQTCPLPTAVLSSQTSGVEGFTFHDLTAEMGPMLDHWQRTAYFITSGHSVQKWKGTDMESMRDTKRIMEREIKKGSTPLTFEQMEIDTDNYQEITSVEKLTQVLQYLHRVGNYKSLAGKTVINNVYTFMRGRTPDFTRARSIFDREKIYHQMLRQERKMKPTYEGDCYIETAKCYFSLPEEWEKHKMIYLNNDAYGFILSNKYILGLYKYCREARRDIAMEVHEIPENTNAVVQRLINMDDLEVMSHCLLLDDVWIENNLIGAKMYTIFKLGNSSQSTAFLL